MTTSTCASPRPFPGALPDCSSCTLPGQRACLLPLPPAGARARPPPPPPPPPHVQLLPLSGLQNTSTLHHSLLYNQTLRMPGADAARNSWASAGRGKTGRQNFGATVRHAGARSSSRRLVLCSEIQASRYSGTEWQLSARILVGAGRRSQAAPGAPQPCAPHHREADRRAAMADRLSRESAVDATDCTQVAHRGGEGHGCTLAGAGVWRGLKQATTGGTMQPGLHSHAAPPFWLSPCTPTTQTKTRQGVEARLQGVPPV